MRFLFVYILLCADGTYYTGVTNDVPKRLKEHEEALNPNSYTARRLPVKLVYFEKFKGPYTAILAEKQLKKWSKKKKEALINGELELLPALAKKDFSKKGSKNS